MQIDLTLLVPDWVLQYESWREFLDVIEQSLNEVASNVDDLRDLYDIEKAKDFIIHLARNFGFDELVYQDIENNVQLLDNQVGFIQWKGSEEFFNWLLQLFNMTAMFRDLSKEVLMWSGGRGWDRSSWEDAKYYRDGSVEATVSVSQFYQMRELERFVSAGVYIWYMVLVGLRMLEMECEVDAAVANAGMALVEGVDSSIGYVYTVGMSSGESIKSYMDATTIGYYMVANPYAIVEPGKYVVLNSYVVTIGKYVVLNSYVVTIS